MVGIDAPWTKKIKTPAYKNMSRDQLQASIDLGNQILSGDVDLVELDNQSLVIRGKSSKTASKKRKLEEDANRGEEMENAKPRKKIASNFESKEKTPTSLTSSQDYLDSDLLTKISQCSKTAFQKRVLSLLCQIPRGRFTTYAAMSTHLQSSPRAIGGACKNNPFAPEVPCHRVLAADGGIGGFKGSWGRSGEAGKNDDMKRMLLRDEGVKFDGKGRVVGMAWSGFEG